MHILGEALGLGLHMHKNIAIAVFSGKRYEDQSCSCKTVLAQAPSKQITLMSHACSVPLPVRTQPFGSLLEHVGVQLDESKRKQQEQPNLQNASRAHAEEEHEQPMEQAKLEIS